MTFISPVSGICIFKSSPANSHAVRTSNHWSGAVCCSKYVLKSLENVQKPSQGLPGTKKWRGLNWSGSGPSPQFINRALFWFVFWWFDFWFVLHIAFILGKVFFQQKGWGSISQSEWIVPPWYKNSKWGGLAQEKVNQEWETTPL